ncbi:MAG TPA: hypothetical protein VN461_14260, partial [Vicinamibacteria bacterium]|nr:hypothetical protein [Vicinamibacteria bacterium]
KSKVGVEIKTNNANARAKEGSGEAEYIRLTGTARGAEVEAVGLARAKGYQAQVSALGSTATALVNVIGSLSEGHAKFVPDILVTGSGNGGSAIDGLAATAMRFLSGPGTASSASGSASPPAASAAPPASPGGAGHKSKSDV